MDDLVFFYPTGHEAHYEPGHQERPERIEVIRKAFEKAGWWEKYPRLDPLTLPIKILQNIHSPEYLDYLRKASTLGAPLDLDTYTTTATWELALKSAGGAAAVGQYVWQRKAKRGFALTRPPGHHATHNRGMGFCLLNNIALTAEFLIQEERAQRLAIVDLDVHHGNGTQDIFSKRVEVLYISTHQYPLYPGTGTINDHGAGIGHGTVINIPLPPFSGDEAYHSAMEKIIIPALSRYMPEMILGSVGFDSHWKDPLANELLSADEYGKLISQLCNWADNFSGGKIALFLEGGYDLEAGVACALAVTSALLGQKWQDPLGPSPYQESTAWQSVIEEVCKINDLQ